MAIPQSDIDNAAGYWRYYVGTANAPFQYTQRGWEVLKPDWLGQTVLMWAIRYTIIGLVPRRPKNNVLLQSSIGRYFYMSPSALASMMPKSAEITPTPPNKSSLSALLDAISSTITRLEDLNVSV